jgi:hypothetical protein
MRAKLLYVDEEHANQDDRGQASLGHFVSPDIYRVIVELNCSDERDGCEELFERFNIGDRAGLRCRSMSVGDVVLRVDEHGKPVAAWICAPVGFESCDPEHFVDVSNPDADEICRDCGSPITEQQRDDGEAVECLLDDNGPGEPPSRDGWWCPHCIDEMNDARITAESEEYE